MKNRILNTVLIATLALTASLTWAAGTKDDHRAMVKEANTFLIDKKPKEAVTEKLDPVIAAFTAMVSTNTAQIYCARDAKETLVYLMNSAVQHAVTEDKDVPVIWGSQFSDTKPSSEVLPQFWAEAYYLKSYALTELGNLEGAKECLQTAVGLSPMNSMYLAELGHIYQVEKNWDMALRAYQESEKAIIHSYSADQDSDKARAWRGQGFVYIEQGKIKEARAMYKKCLELNKEDSRAQAELNYIDSLKNSKK